MQVLEQLTINTVLDGVHHLRLGHDSPPLLLDSSAQELCLKGNLCQHIKHLQPEAAPVTAEHSAFFVKSALAPHLTWRDTCYGVCSTVTQRGIAPSHPATQQGYASLFSYNSHELSESLLHFQQVILIGRRTQDFLFGILSCNAPLCDCW